VKEGEPVTETAYRILELMKLRPFSFYMKVKAVYDQGELIDLNLVKQAEKMMKKGLDNVRLVDRFISTDPLVSMTGEVECGILPNDTVVTGDGDDSEQEGEGLFNIFGDEEESGSSGGGNTQGKGRQDDNDGDDGEDNNMLGMGSLFEED